jgi:hypothetical protein
LRNTVVFKDSLEKTPRTPVFVMCDTLVRSNVIAIFRYAFPHVDKALVGFRFIGIECLEVFQKRIGVREDD